MSAPEDRIVGLTYRGKPVEELIKEELIEALYRMSRLLEDTRKNHEDYVKFERDMREMR